MENRKVIRNDQNPNVIAQVAFRFIPYWPLFLILLLLAGTGAWLYLRFTPKLYESKASLLIKDEKKGVEDTKSMDELNVLAPKKIIENEMEVIQSRALLTDVTQKLHLYAPIFEKGKFRDAPAYVVSPVKIELRNPEKIQRADKVDFTYDKSSRNIIVGSNRYPINQWVTTSYGELRFIDNPDYKGAQTQRGLYFSIVEPRSIVTSIQGRLKVSTASKQSSILDLTLTDEEPQRGKDILNALLISYEKAMLTDKKTLAENTLTFVDDRLDSIRKDLTKIEQRNQQYKSKQRAVDIGEQGRLYLQNVSSNDQKLGDINTQMAVLSQVESYVRSKNTDGGIVPSTLGVSDPLLSQLVNNLYTSELEYEKLKQTTGENSPTMLALNDQINKIRPSILENIQSQKRSLQASQSNLALTNGRYSSILSNIPEEEKELIDINREQNIKSGIYSFLLQKREETALSNSRTVSDSRVVDTAESSDSPVSPKTRVVYIAAILAALLLGIGIVTAKESLSRNIMFRHEIEILTQQPIIGEIVYSDTKNQIVIGDEKKTFIAEQFRKLRSSLKFAGITPQKKRILVTSSISGEGKSFVAANLALSLALTGKKVILIDCDLNNPSLSSKLEIKEEIGVTEYLLSNADVNDIIKKTTINDNLFFIATGELPHNPSELIMNGRIEELLNHLDGVFDYIVVDTAPVSPVTDAYAISPFCDATLFVIRHKYTPKVIIERMDENNKINHLHNVAIVFNGVSSRGFGSKNYGYGYGYGYIYKENQRPKQLRISNTKG